MTYQGTVKDGVVVFQTASPPEGTVVRVEAVDASPTQRDTIWEKMTEFSGRVPELPVDAARHHDEYLYGKPKR